MRHFHKSRQSVTPFSEYPSIKLELNEVASCSFIGNGRFTSQADQGVGGFTLRVGQGTVDNPNALGENFSKSLTSGPIGTCKEMTFHVAGFVKDGYIHVGVLFEAANRESLVTNPHEVYEIEAKVAVRTVTTFDAPPTEAIFIGISPRSPGETMDYSISGDIYS